MGSIWEEKENRKILKIVDIVFLIALILFAIIPTAEMFVDYRVNDALYNTTATNINEKLNIDSIKDTTIYVRTNIVSARVIDRDENLVKTKFGYIIDKDKIYNINDTVYLYEDLNGDYKKLSNTLINSNVRYVDNEYDIPDNNTIEVKTQADKDKYVACIKDIENLKEYKDKQTRMLLGLEVMIITIVVLVLGILIINFRIIKEIVKIIKGLKSNKLKINEVNQIENKEITNE